MEPFYNKNDEDARLKRDDAERPSGIVGAFFHSLLIPGFIGIIVSLFLGKFGGGLVRIVANHEPVGRGIDRIFTTLNTEVAQLLALDWDKNTLWMYLVFGFVAGVVIKHAYSDDRKL